MDLTVLVPVYNSEATLPTLHARVCAALEPVGTFELVLVDDCSRDGSWRVIQELAAKDPRVRGIQLARNMGQHNALLCGVRAAHGRTTVTIDDDLQNPPEEIPKLLARLDEGFDVVYGAPQKERHGLLRDLASRITKLSLARVLGSDVAENASAFRAFRTDLRAAFTHYHDTFVFLDVLLSWGTSRFSAVAVRHEARTVGQSGYTFTKLVVHALTMITGFSTLPLHAASVLGLLLTAFGFAVLVWVIGRLVITGTSAPGFPFLASTIAIFSGAQLFALGVIGEYLGRVHQRTMGQPQVVVRSTVGLDEKAPWPVLGKR